MTASGWIILDKDSGLFSRTAGGRVARMIGTKKFGHIGTLDPMATGVLPIAIGDATKMIPFVEERPGADIKEYMFSLQFGFETDTLDITGRVLRRDDFIPDESAVIAALPQMLGGIMQTPPAFSAVHIDGARAYDLARRGAVVDVPTRRVHIYALDFTGRDGDVWGFRVRCSRGTYVRALARDIAASVGAIATVDMIRRVATGQFDIKNAVKLDFLENLYNNGGDIGAYLMSVDSSLADIPVLNLRADTAAHFAHGGFVQTAAQAGLTRVYNGNDFIGIGCVDGNVLRPKRII